jgi:hypothetical protein
MVAFISYGNFVRAWTKLNVHPKNLSGKTVLITGGNEGIYKLKYEYIEY